MVFSSPIFLFVYLPIVLAIYYIFPLKWRNLPLLICNLVFYAWGEPIYILIMFASTLLDYTHGLLVRRFQRRGKIGAARAALISSILVNLGMLFFFKYWDWIAAATGVLPVFGVPLPIGISFYTFQTMSYTIDVYRGETEAQRNIINFGTYVTLFPQLIAGPIVRYKDVDDQLTYREHSFQKFSSGITRFTVGLCKKVLLANQFGLLWDACSAAAHPSAAGAWLGILAFTFQIYFDFSGYSDMAIGLGRMLGFEFTENFNYPYISRSITEFWRRWHISLGTWFREYLYIPLGGNRHGRARWLLSTVMVWACTGIWHGASLNFLCWGLYFCVILIVEKMFFLRVLERLPRFVQHLYALLLIVLGWVIFAIEDFSVLLAYLHTMFCGTPYTSDFLYRFCSFLPLLAIAAIAATPICTLLWNKLSDKLRAVLLPILILAGLTLSTAYLVGGSYNPFLYFRF